MKVTFRELGGNCFGTGGRAREGKAKWRDVFPCLVSLCKVPAPQIWPQTPPTAGMCQTELHSQLVPAALSMAAGPDPAFSQPPTHSNPVFLGLCYPHRAPPSLRRGRTGRHSDMWQGRSTASASIKHTSVPSSLGNA